jgi:hypothetical protein
MDKSVIERQRVELKNLKEQHKQECNSFFLAVTQKLFEKYPALKSFTWQQYTAYYCDGGPCGFYVRGESTSFNESDLTLDELLSESPWVDKDEEATQLKAAAEEIQELFAGFTSNEYRQMFGDHKEITVTKDGIKVEDYEDHS